MEPVYATIAAARRAGGPAGLDPVLLGEMWGRRRSRDAAGGPGAFHTPSEVAKTLALAVVERCPRPAFIVDPGVGGGALLVAVADRLVSTGWAPGEVVGRLGGFDLDESSVRITRAGLEAWAASHGVVDRARPDRIVVGDALDPDTWARLPSPTMVVANPPFLSPLKRRSERSATRRRLAADLVGRRVRYSDEAMLFLLQIVRHLEVGGVAGVVTPRSAAAAADAEPIRTAVGRLADLLDVVDVKGQPFDAAVETCIPIVERLAPRPGRLGDDFGARWRAHLADHDGIPRVDLTGARRLGQLGTVVTSFRQHYYALARHVAEHDELSDPVTVITTGLVDPLTSHWGRRPARLGRRLDAPAVDRSAVVVDDVLGGWASAVLRPKVVVASQTAIVEAVFDSDGAWLPATPLISFVPHDPALGAGIAVLLSTPAVSAWCAHRAVGTGRSRGSMRLTAALLRQVPVPVDDAILRRCVGQPGEVPGLLHLAPATLAWWMARGGQRLVG